MSAAGESILRGLRQAVKWADNPACPPHDCRDHMRYRIAECVETHGLDCGPYERWRDEWWECALCGEREEA